MIEIIEEEKKRGKMFGGVAKKLFADLGSALSDEDVDNAPSKPDFLDNEDLFEDSSASIVEDREKEEYEV